MNRITRVLAMAGLGIGATIALAGPAQAANTHSASASTRANWGDDDVVGYYNSSIACDRAGRLGEIRGDWDDYDCSPAGFGFRGGNWELTVDGDDWGGFDGRFDHD